MTIREYISSKLSKFGVSSTEIDVLLIETGLDGSADISVDGNLKTAQTAIYYHIPGMLAGLSEIAEGDYRIKWNSEGILAWWRWLGSELGIEEISAGDEIVDRSDLW